MNNLFDVAFATRNSQSIMQGCASYYYQYPAAVVEADVERIIITKAQAANLVVGSVVSIGNATALSSGAPNIDRGQTGMHAKANRVLITKIEDYDESNSAVYVDNGGTKFSTASTVVSDVDCPTYISTMPWRTGTCDSVLGSCGSPVSNTNGKFPYVLFGVEMMLGMYEVCGNAVMKNYQWRDASVYLLRLHEMLFCGPDRRLRGSRIYRCAHGQRMELHCRPWL